jgi:hypothetical protein
MRRFTLPLLAFAATLGAVVAAQQPAPPTIQQVGLFVYPAKGQTKDQQTLDEKACTEWAVAQGADASKQADVAASGQAAKGQAAEATTGAAVVGAAKGAAGGAAIGAIAGDAGKGAAIGAVAGAMGGRRAKKQAEAQAQKQGEAQAAAYNQQQIDAYKKALSACLEGKGYTVK